MLTFLNDNAPAILALLGAILTPLLALLFDLLRKRFGLDVDARNREALHSALMTGAQLALSRKLTGAAALKLMLDYASVSVPGAITHFGASTDQLRKMAEAKFEQAGAAAAAKAGDELADALRKAGVAL